jgi:hypothetical protein
MMTTQKTFKRRVRARMTKTGESYTAARQQLLRKAPAQGAESVEAVAPAGEPAAADVSEAHLLTSDDAMRKGSGKSHGEWFALLDEWGASERRHPEIAGWLGTTHGVPGWWAQNITVAWERARGIRARHQMADGFSVSVTRTVGVVPEHALDAFTDPELRRRWLPVGGLARRPTRAAGTARFDWPDPPSRIVVSVDPKDAGRSVVGVAHEKLPDAEAAERLKASWRAWLSALKALVEGS